MICSRDCLYSTKTASRVLALYQKANSSLPNPRGYRSIVRLKKSHPSNFCQRKKQTSASRQAADIVATKSALRRH